MNGRAVWAMVKKEFLDNVRNRWIVAVTLVFIALAIIVSYVGGLLYGLPLGFQGFKETAIGTIHVTEYLVPIIGIMLGYAAIAGEHEAGSLGLVLSTPITRGELLLGKFLGLGAVLTVSILVGLGVAGGVIAAAAGAAAGDTYVVLVAGTVLEGLAFLAIALMLSTLTTKRSVALGGGVLLWFLLVLVWSLLLFGVYVAMGGAISLDPARPVVYDFPGWWWGLALANPMFAGTMFQLIPTNEVALGSFGQMVLPGYVNLWTTALPVIAWIVVCLLVAYLRLGRRDL